MVGETFGTLAGIWTVAPKCTGNHCILHHHVLANKEKKNPVSHKNGLDEALTIIPLSFNLQPWPGSSIRTSSLCTKVVGLILGQGTFKKQLMNASISETTNQCFSLPLSKT